MKIRKALFLILFLPLFALSQKAVLRNVIIAKESGKQFQELSAFKYLSTNLKDVKINSEVLGKGVLLQPNLKVLNTILEEQPEQFTLVIPLSATSSIKVDLLKHKIFADGFFVSTNKEPNAPILYNEGVHYKGVIQGDSNSIVAFSFFKGEIVGLISDLSGNRVIGKIESDAVNTHLLYNDINLSVRNPFECSTGEDGIGYTNSQLQKNGGNTTSSLGDCINVYIEVDDDVVTGKGGAVNATNYVTALFNQCIVLYSNESLSMAVSQIMCWTSSSPYSGATTTSALLGSYQSNTGAFNGDLSHLVSYRGGGGQAAGFSGICSVDPDQSKCVSKINSTYLNVPTYSWSVMVITHEMGHLIGSRHTHACVWNGNNTAIDGCAGYVEGGCVLPGNPVGGGTIMSYCHTVSVGINLSLGFGSQPGAVIRNTVLNATCLHSCGYTSCTDGFLNGQETGIDCGGPSCPVCPVTCTTPTGVTVTSISVTTALVNWAVVTGAVTYTLEYKLNSSPTWIVASSTISNAISYYLTGLTGSSLYDYRIKTNCSSGSSIYFQSQFTTITAAACYSNYEPNESRAAAATIPANTIITATIGTASDLDYYKLTTAVASDFNISLTNLAGDYDLEMFNSAGTSIATSGNAGTTSESIVLANQAAGTYYFYVYGYGGAYSPTICYNFNVGVVTSVGCNAPLSLVSSAITSTSATVSWGAVGSAINYNVEYKLSTASIWTVATSTLTLTTYTFTGLTIGTLYDYRISANCASGISPYAQAQFTTSPLCISAYEPNESQAAAVVIPANSTVSAGINTTTDLDYFNVITTGVVNFNVTLTNLPADFDLHMLNSAGTVIASSANGSTTSESIVLANQAAGTYTFKVFGYAGATSTTVCYNLFVGTTAVITCSTPTTLSTTLITNSSATFNWAAVSGAISYAIQYRIVGAPSWTSTTSATNSVAVAGLTELSNYEWQVQTVCASGSSTFSSSVLFTTLCTTPSATITPGGATTFCSGGNVVLTANSGSGYTYQWSLNGSTIVGATAISYTASVGGNYTVQVTSGTCSTVSGITTVTVLSTPTITLAAPTSGIVGGSVVITGTNFINVSTVKFNSVLASFIVNSSTQITATVPVGATTGFISVTTPCGNAISPSPFTVIVNYSLQVKLLIEGYYLGGGLMRAVANPSTYPTICDTVDIELANSIAPFAIAYFIRGVVNTSGVGTFLFPLTASSGNYYIVVTHRNSLQTWSANPIAFIGTSTSYDFTTAANKAHGNNQAVHSDGKAMMFSGDVNQDDMINSSDFAIVNSNINLFQVGYLNSDLTGDRCVEASDYSLIENHYSGISLSRP